MEPTKDTNPLIEKALEGFGSQAALAEAAGFSQTAINFILNGKMGISAEMAVGIDRATGGRVSKSDLRPDLWPRETENAA